MHEVTSLGEFNMPSRCPRPACFPKAVSFLRENQTREMDERQQKPEEEGKAWSQPAMMDQLLLKRLLLLLPANTLTCSK